jgi:hypothetical protein
MRVHEANKVPEKSSAGHRFLRALHLDPESIEKRKESRGATIRAKIVRLNKAMEARKRDYMQYEQLAKECRSKNDLRGARSFSLSEIWHRQRFSDLEQDKAILLEKLARIEP